MRGKTEPAAASEGVPEELPVGILEEEPENGVNGAPGGTAWGAGPVKPPVLKLLESPLIIPAEPICRIEELDKEPTRSEWIVMAWFTLTIMRCLPC